MHSDNDRGYHLHRMKKIAGMVSNIDFFSWKSTLPTCPIPVGINASGIMIICTIFARIQSLKFAAKDVECSL